MRCWSILAVVITLFSTALAHRLDIEAGKQQCFYETLNPEDKMTVTYEVGGATNGGDLSIDFWVNSPDGKEVWRNNGESQGSFAVTASWTGRYWYCFNNPAWSSRKTVSFNVHGVLYVDDDEQTAPVENEIRELAHNLQMVKDEQAYLVVRERVHRDTCESTNDRVKWWSIIQVIILLAFCGWNVHYLKSWFEVKRIL